MRKHDGDLMQFEIATGRGLMFRKEIGDPLLFVLNKGKNVSRWKASIHSLFVTLPFSAIWVDQDNRIVDIRICKPFTSLVVPKKDPAYLIEGDVELAKDLKIGDRFELEG